MPGLADPSAPTNDDVTRRAAREARAWMGTANADLLLCYHHPRHPVELPDSRYLGLRRNACAFNLQCAAYNIRRASSLLVAA